MAHTILQDADRGYICKRRPILLRVAGLLRKLLKINNNTAMEEEEERRERRKKKEEE